MSAATAHLQAAQVESIIDGATLVKAANVLQLAESSLGDNSDLTY
jgi:hypothetical protein